MTGVPEEDGETPLVSLHGLRKSFPGFTLGPVDLDLHPGYVMAVVGPNGCGKTTLFRAIMNLVHPDAGERSLFGRHYSDGELEIKREIGYVPDAATGHDEMTADELGSFVRHWYPSWDHETFHELLRRFDIPRAKRFKKLSTGMRQRLSLATAVATRARLLVLDEPTAGIDALAGRTVLDEISDYVEDGRRGVLVSMHSLDDVNRVADYITFLAEGRCLGTYEKDELRDSWQALWVDELPGDPLPGVVKMAKGTPARLVTNSPYATRAALEERRVNVVRTAGIELEEIFAHLVAQSKFAEQAGVSGQERASRGAYDRITQKGGGRGHA